ncbi:hypothetical protein L596_013367 [Steinernema carpocapsae]|uniref:UPAR/Ly6 domain-containing protein n=1 Tax=Steinernema carpocapsae TaxID=34508 RepID=A0A4U5P0L1_STECR|nr:hypothetical protein L596_013367 [Steinernema carpocapsae]
MPGPLFSLALCLLFNPSCSIKCHCTRCRHQTCDGEFCYIYKEVTKIGPQIVLRTQTCSQDSWWLDIPKYNGYKPIYTDGNNEIGVKSSMVCFTDLCNSDEQIDEHRNGVGNMGSSVCAVLVMAIINL